MGLHTILPIIVDNALFKNMCLDVVLPPAVAGRRTDQKMDAIPPSWDENNFNNNCVLYELA